MTDTSGRALLEVLRAPLLLSPFADVGAGWALATVVSAVPPGLESRMALAAACLTGGCLLAAGMAQNALADRLDDEERKPERPIPRGAISAGAVAVTWAVLTLMAVAIASFTPPMLPWTVAIIALTAAYHYLLKPSRVTGCVALGTLRGLDMSLGVVAAGAMAATTTAPAAPAWLPWSACVAYGLYITGASLHASTDDAEGDESGEAAWSRRGLGLCQGLLVGGAIACVATDVTSVEHWAAAALLVLQLVRLVRGARRLPPPAVTGVALSGLYLTGAAITLAAGNVALAALILSLFFLGRALMRVFPPS